MLTWGKDMRRMLRSLQRNTKADTIESSRRLLSGKGICRWVRWLKRTFSGREKEKQTQVSRLRLPFLLLHYFIVTLLTAVTYSSTFLLTVTLVPSSLETILALPSLLPFPPFNGAIILKDNEIIKARNLSYRPLLSYVLAATIEEEFVKVKAWSSDRLPIQQSPSPQITCRSGAPPSAETVITCLAMNLFAFKKCSHSPVSFRRRFKEITFKSARC